VNVTERTRPSSGLWHPNKKLERCVDRDIDPIFASKAHGVLMLHWRFDVYT